MFAVLILAAVGRRVARSRPARPCSRSARCSWRAGSSSCRASGVPETELIWVSIPICGTFLIAAASARHSERARRAEERARRDGSGGAAGGRGRARPDHARAARRARPLGQRDDRAGERRPPAADAGAGARAGGADDGRGDGPSGTRRDAAAARDPAHRRRSVPRSRRSPGIGTLPELVEQVRQSGLPVELTVEGDAGQAARRRRPVRLPHRAGSAHEHAQARRACARVGRRPLRGRGCRDRSGERRVERERRRRRPGTASSACASASRSAAASSSPARGRAAASRSPRRLPVAGGAA